MFRLTMYKLNMVYYGLKVQCIRTNFYFTELNQ